MQTDVTMLSCRILDIPMMTLKRTFLIESTFLLIAGLMPLSSLAQETTPIYNSEVDRDAIPLAPEDAAATMQVPAGFRVNVFSSEPEVQNPIAMTWDRRGRLWIAENYTYAERSQRFDLGLRDRVVVLEDADQDGIAERHTIFTDQVQMLTSVEIGYGGVWLMCPPQLLFVPDADRNDVPDGPAVVVLDGFEVAQENYHNFANGLKWGPDGWLYGRCGGSCPGRIGVPGTPDDRRVALEGGIWRYHPQKKYVEVLTHGTTNPWGHDWNAMGEAFFVNTVNGHLWHLVPGAHLVRPFTLDPNPHVYELIDMHADHWHFDTGTSWQDSRDGKSNSYGGGHAHSGAMIYLGDNWPQQYCGRLLTLNFHGRRANQEILERAGSGYVARHGGDLLISDDPFFRGIDLSYGPDGAVYIIDWSDTGECHESSGVHRTSGRVYRAVFAESPQQKATQQGPLKLHDLRDLSDDQLLGLLKHRNEWFVRQARLILAERAAMAPDFARHQQLRDLVQDSNPVVAYRALTTLYCGGGADSGFLQQQLHHPNEHLRVWAIRLLTDSWAIDDVFGPLAVSPARRADIAEQSAELLDVFCEMARSDPSGLVRLTLASTLQRLPVTDRARLAGALMSRAEDAEDHNLPLLVWYGLIPVAEDNPGPLAPLVANSTWPKTQRLMARRIAESIELNPGALQQILTRVSSSSDESVRKNILFGIADGLKGWRKAPRPVGWQAVVHAVSTSDDAELKQTVRELSVLFGDGRALAEVRQLVLDSSAEIDLRRSALATLVDAGGDDLLDICLPLLDDARLNVVAARGLAKYSDPKVAEKLLAAYRHFRGPERPQVIAILVSRPSFAAALLDAIAAGKIPAGDLTAFDVRQIRSLDDDRLTDRVTELWGEVRDTPAERQAKIAELKETLDADTLLAADPGAGRLLFNQSCAKCHRLFGDGENIGPDLTGANRTNLDYLLENILDPSAVVNKDFRMTVVQLDDGRVLNGLVVSKNDKTLTLQTQTDRQTVELDAVEAWKTTNQSPMPDGLLDNLSPDQIRDFLFYLMQPSQVPLPNTLP
jgi:putative membrane-bound dehydrogenase-like protein